MCDQTIVRLSEADDSCSHILAPRNICLRVYMGFCVLCVTLCVLFVMLTSDFCPNICVRRLYVPRFNQSCQFFSNIGTVFHINPSDHHALNHVLWCYQVDSLTARDRRLCYRPSCMLLCDRAVQINTCFLFAGWDRQHRVDRCSWAKGREGVPLVNLDMWRISLICWTFTHWY